MYEKGSHFDMAIDNLEAIIYRGSFGSGDNKDNAKSSPPIAAAS
jgi:hypothetical protein